MRRSTLALCGVSGGSRRFTRVKAAPDAFHVADGV